MDRLTAQPAGFHNSHFNFVNFGLASRQVRKKGYINRQGMSEDDKISSNLFLDISLYGRVPLTSSTTFKIDNSYYSCRILCLIDLLGRCASATHQKHIFLLFKIGQRSHRGYEIKTKWWWGFYSFSFKL